MPAKRLTHTARKLRNDPTDAERRLWSRLRGRQLGVQFTRQFPIGGAIVDLACRRARLAIELDGGQHADNPADEGRTRMIEAHGYVVLRFWNNDVLANTDGVVQRIAEALALASNREDWWERGEFPHPQPLPAGEGSCVAFDATESPLPGGEGLGVGLLPLPRILDPTPHSH